MAKKIDVLTFGDLCVDLIMSGSDVVLEFGQKEKLAEDYSLEMGGSCSIFACQTAKLGLGTAVVGKVGNDSFGELICKSLKAAGVTLDYINRDDSWKTGITLALNKVDDRAMLTYNGTIDAVGIDDVSDELLKSVRHLHIGSYFLMKRIQPYYPEIIKRHKANGATVSLDTNWDPEEKWDSGIWDIIPHIDIFFPNENEAMAITGENSAEKAIGRLRKLIPVIAVKKGKDGAAIFAGGKVFNTPAVDVEKVDAVGAGDSFDAGFVYGFLSGRSIEECAQLGSITGSLSIRKAGGTRGQPRLEETLKYLKYIESDKDLILKVGVKQKC